MAAPTFLQELQLISASRLMFCMALLVAPSSAWSADVSSPRHAVIAADKGQLVRFDASGKVVWTCDLVKSVHRIQQLENGNLLTQQGWGRIVEIKPSPETGGEIVWSYDAQSKNGNAGKKLEVHAFQRLEDGSTMIVENGVGRIIEISQSGEILHEIPYQVSQTHPHRDVRMAYKLENGNYLVCHEGEGRVTEYNHDGDIVWDYDVPLFGAAPKPGHGPEAWGNQVFNALRLPNGNTLVATGNGHSVLEVTPEKEIVWQLHQNDLQGITLAWITSLEVRPNGNIIIGNCHAGENQPQLIEVDRDHNVVWTFYDFENLGNATAASAIVE